MVFCYSRRRGDEAVNLIYSPIYRVGVTFANHYLGWRSWLHGRCLKGRSGLLRVTTDTIPILGFTLLFSGLSADDCVASIVVIDRLIREYADILTDDFLQPELVPVLITNFDYFHVLAN